MAPKYRPLESILIKPSGPDCNLNCKYCFYLEKSALFPESKIHRMSDEVLEEMIRQAMSQAGQNVAFAWQGGEPALMGLDFYQKAVDFEMKYGRGQSVGNGFQTNGTLLNRDWAKFFAKYNFLIGLSIDGPQHVHDHYRIDQGGKPTHAKVESIAKMLLDEGVATNAMSVITSYSVNYAEEIYNYHKDLGLTYMQFIPIVETDPNDPSKAADYSVGSLDYGKFLIQLFNLWINDFRNGQPTTSVRQFESIFHRYVGLPAPECTFMKECGIYVVIEHNGNVYGCDFFVDPKYKLGNIKHEKMINMLNSKRQQQFGAAKANLPNTCRQCRWLTYCYGGCTKDRIKDPQDHNKPRFCEGYKLFFDYADPMMKQLAEQWKQGQKDFNEQQQTGGTYNAFDHFVGNKPQ